jgi:hypothetical protein
VIKDAVQARENISDGNLVYHKRRRSRRNAEHVGKHKRRLPHFESL